MKPKAPNTNKEPIPEKDSEFKMAIDKWQKNKLIEIRPIQCGTMVVIKLSGIEAIITCVSNRFDNISYELTYYFNGEQHVVWCNAMEFEMSNSIKYPLGFVKPGVMQDFIK